MGRIARQPHLVRSLSALFPNADIDLRWRKPWHSMTFSGERIGLRIDVAEEDAAHLQAGLSDASFDLRKSFVADMQVVSVAVADCRVLLDIELLVLEE